MLNELAQVVAALNSLGTATGSRHPRINPMGKNNDLLIVCLTDDGTPASFSVVPGETATTLFRVEHGSAGSSFPGFNVSTPLRSLDHIAAERLVPAVEHVLSLNKNKGAPNSDLASALRKLTPHKGN